MAKIFILLTCLVWFCAAGVLDTSWMRGERDDWTGNVRSIEMEDINRLTRMTDSDLVRQRILLKLLDRVHETLDDVELRNVRVEFDANERNYNEGMDDDMLYVVELQRNGRLLGKRDTFTIVKPDHKRQMIGLKRLLSCAIDFETFVQNALTARNRMNGVLFVNALILAVRERDDTRNLIVPAIAEILPELFIDRDTLRTLMNIDLNLLTTRSGYNTRRPVLMDMITMNGRMERTDRWGQLGSLVSLNRNRLDMDVGKIVIDEVNKDRKATTMKLLTEDVGFKGFLHSLINDLCLKENELEKSQTRENTMARIGGGLADLDYRMRQRKDMRLGSMGREHRINEDMYGGKIGIYGSNQWNNKLGLELPTTTIDDENLLHVSGRRLIGLYGNNRRINNFGQNENMRNRYYDVLNINDGRRTVNNFDNTVLNSLNRNCINCIDRQIANECNQCYLTTDGDVLDLLGYECKKCIRDMSDDDCDKCKNNVNIGEMGLQRRRSDSTVWNKRIVDGRRTTNTDDWNDDITNNDLVNRLSAKCIKCIERKTVDDCNKCKRTTADEVINELGNNCKNCIQDVNSYDCDTCRQQISLGIRNIGQAIDYSRLNSAQNTRDRFMNVLMRRQVDDGRRTKYINDIDGWLNDDLDMNRLNINCRRCIVSKTMGDCDMCKRTTEDFVLDRLDKDCRNCINDVNDYECDKCQNNIMNSGINGNRFGNAGGLTWNRGNWLGGNRRSMENNLGVNVLDVMDRKKSTKSEVLLNNLKQVLSRINLERISLGLDTTEGNIADNNRMRNSGISGMTDIRTIDRLMNILRTNIISKIQNVQVAGSLTDIEVDRVIAKALIERNSDSVNIIDILTDVIVQNVGERENMPIVRDIGDALNNEKVLNILRKIVETVDQVRTEILGTYKIDDLELDDVEINDVVVDELVTRTMDTDIDLRNLVEDKNKVIVVRQQQLTHDDFSIQIDVGSKRSQRVVVRTLIGPKRIDNMGRVLTLNDRRLGFMLLDTNIVDLEAGRNVVQLGSRDMVWSQRDTTTLRQIYNRIMWADRDIGTTYRSDVVIGQDCRFPQRLVLPRGRADGLDLELLVVITRYDGDVDVRDESSIKCAMGMSVKGADRKSLGFPLDRRIDDVRDLRSLKNVVGVDIKIYHVDRKGLNW